MSNSATPAIRNESDRFINSEIEEARRVRAFLDFTDISKESPLWHAPGVPTFWNSIILGSQLNAQRIERKSTRSESHSGQIIHHVALKVKVGKHTRWGAASNESVEISTELAYRNAIRQLLINDPSLKSFDTDFDSLRSGGRI